jgi:PST family polysaccharide transporter
LFGKSLEQIDPLSRHKRMSLSPCDGHVSAPSLESSPQNAKLVTGDEETYGQILKSSALIGGSSAMNIAFGIVRTKAMAVLLGPAGFGLIGLYGSITNLTQSLAGMGVNSSGVRQIAAAVGSGEAERIARTTAVLRRTSILLGALGSALLVVFARQVSTLTFGTAGHASAVCLLSVAVFLQLVSAGQGALIQGMRRISDLAKMGVLGALLGTLISIPVIYFLREKGVVPALIGVALMSLAVSWWYSRKVHIHTPSMTLSEIGREAGALLKLGFAFMASGFMTMGIAYAVRIMLRRRVGLEATGLYQAAWTIGGLYAGFILQTMGADFYPRLTARAHDNAVCNRLVNEQAQVGLLLAGPGVIATLTLAPIVIALFYSRKFDAAVGVLRWLCVGITLQVVTWPLAFIVVAKGRQAIFFGSELAWAVVSLGFAWISVRKFGLTGAGIAFGASYIFYGFLIYNIVHRISGFRWSTPNKRTGILFFSLIAVVLCGFYVLPPPAALCLGLLAVLFGGTYSIRVLLKLVAWDRAPSPVLRLFIGLGLAPSSDTRVT